MDPQGTYQTYTVPLSGEMPDGIDLAALVTYLSSLDYAFPPGDGISRIVGADGTPAYVLAADRDPTADIEAYRPATTPDQERAATIGTYRAADQALATATDADFADAVKTYRAAASDVLRLFIPEI